MSALFGLVVVVFLLGGAAAVVGVFIVAPILGVVRVLEHRARRSTAAIERDAAAEELAAWLESFAATSAPEPPRLAASAPSPSSAAPCATA